MKGKKILRWLRRAGIALAALLVVAAILLIGLFRRPWPQVSGRLQVAGLVAPAEIVRDRWGVPHLYAANEHDLFFAQGYVHAQDRLWQMHWNRVVGGGRLSSLFGAETLPTDRYLRTLGLRRAAERDWAVLSADTRAILTAYAAGVNAFLSTHHGTELPVEFTLLRVTPEPWTPIDSLTWTRLMALNLSLNSQAEPLRARLIAALGARAAAELLPPYPADAPTIIPPPPPDPADPQKRRDLAVTSGLPNAADRFAAAVLPAVYRPGRAWGSNAWVVSGSRTKSGRPLLANDTHLGLGMPSVWYENGLSGGRFQGVGFSFPGLPMLVLGENRRIAWGITNLNADVQDLYLEKLDDAKHPRRALFRGRWEELRSLSEEIPVKGGKTETLRVLSTRHGPLVNDLLPSGKDPRPIALAWAAADHSRLLDAISGVNRAAGWEEFRAALALWDTPSLNFVYADVAGNIGYQSSAETPMRVPGHDGSVPVPGWSGDHEWRGYIPWDEMPHVLNPPAGYVVTANNKVVGDDYPYVLTVDWAAPDRARRINALLAASRRPLDLADMQTMQRDTFLKMAGDLRPFLLAAVHPKGAAEEAALAGIRGWNLRFDPAEIGPTIYEAWLRFLLPDIFADELGPELTKSVGPLVFVQTDMVYHVMARADSPWFDDRRTPRIETRDDIVRKSFSEAVEWLRKLAGDDPAGWRWERFHAISFAEQPLGGSGLWPLTAVFNSRRLAVGGEDTTVDSTGSDPDHPFEVGFGVSQRFIADLADLGRSVAVNSTGQSAHPFHPHREDQSLLWARGEYHPVLATREALRERTEAVLTLVPR